MCKRMLCLASLLVVLGTAGGAYGICSESILGGNTVTVNAGETWTVNCGERFYIGQQEQGTGHLVVNGGAVNITTAERFCVEYNSDITLNEGEITVTANGEGWYFPDDGDSGTGPRIFVNGGVFTMNNSAYEADCSRDGHVYVGCGTFRCKTDLRNECGGTIHAAPGNEPLIYSSEGGFHVFTGSRCATKVEFESAASGAPESESPAVLTVTLSEIGEQVVTVDYAVTGGTAAAGEDYNLAGGTLSFEPGETSKTISIEIINDGADEEDETIEVTLSNVEGGEAELGDTKVHVCTIVDPRPSVGFESGASFAQEDSGTAVVEVVLSAAVGEEITVEYAVTGGTAGGGGVDYTLSDGSLSFAPGQTAKTITVALVDDDIEEYPDETVEITLSNQTNSKLGISRHVLSISDMGPMWTNSLGMTFVRIMPGMFSMGKGSELSIRDGGSGDYDEQPEHPVGITKAFYILKNKVSNQDYAQLGLSGASDTSWTDANRFCELLSDLEGRNYHIATEAQWEYAYEKYSGDVQDMGGREWVYDWHKPYLDRYKEDPSGPETGVLKVIRQGNERYTYPTCARTKYGAPAMGFRVVMEFDERFAASVQPAVFCQSAIKQSTEPAQEGPDADEPYFLCRFALPIPPDDSSPGEGALHGVCPSVMFHHHSPGMEIMPNGDVVAMWYSAHDNDSEMQEDVRFIQARLRYGSDLWDPPEIFYDVKHKNEQAALLWREQDGSVWFFGGGRFDEAYSGQMAFKVARSTDSGATWDMWVPEISGGLRDWTPQPITNAFRDPSGNLYFAMDACGECGNSFLWKTSDNGITWRQQSGRTNGRHSSIVPLSDGTLLSIGGQDTDIGGYMPQHKSRDWGASWRDPGRTPFAPQHSNGRPSMIKLANGHLAVATDAQRRDGFRPDDIGYPRGVIIAISTNEGQSWHIRNLPVGLCHEEDRDDWTFGYAICRQGPNGVIHIATAMTHPCLHYELNEAWAFSSAGDIPPETTGGTIKQYSENHPGGQLKAAWSARITPGGRYLLHGRDVSYYEDGTKEHEVTYENGRPTGTETYWLRDGTRLWSWEHNAANKRSVWTHYYANGLKKLQSTWRTYGPTRDSSRNFSGFMADGPVYHWDRMGNPRYGSPQQQVKTPDLYDDGCVDSADLLLMTRNWLWEGPVGGFNIADLNLDGKADLVDFAIFAAEWSKNCP